jgi:hypothetical protein
MRAHLLVHHHLLPTIATLKPAALLADPFSYTLTLKIIAFALVMSLHPYSPNEKTSSRLAALDSKDYLTIFYRVLLLFRFGQP